MENESGKFLTRKVSERYMTCDTAIETEISGKNNIRN